MTFKEKIDNLLRVSGKKFNSVYDLEVKSGVGMGTLRKAYDENREPSKRTIWKFLESLSINPEWWETGNGSIYLEKPTQGDKMSDNKENPIQEAEVYRTIVEGNTEYLLIPRSVLQDKYRLRSLEDIEKDQKVLDRLLDAHEKMLDRLLLVDPKFVGIQESKQDTRLPDTPSSLGGPGQQ